MTKLFDRNDTNYEFQESIEQGSWQPNRSDFSTAADKVRSVMHSMRALADSEGLDLDALASNANNALGERTSRATVDEIRKIAEVEISDFRHPLP